MKNKYIQKTTNGLRSATRWAAPKIISGVQRLGQGSKRLAQNVGNKSRELAKKKYYTVVNPTKGDLKRRSQNQKYISKFVKNMAHPYARVPPARQRYIEEKMRIKKLKQRLAEQNYRDNSQTYDEQVVNDYYRQHQLSLQKLRMMQSKAVRMNEAKKRLQDMQRQNLQAANVLSTPNMFDPTNPLANNWGSKIMDTQGSILMAENIFSNRNPRRTNILKTGRPSILSPQKNNILRAHRLNFGNVNLREEY